VRRSIFAVVLVVAALSGGAASAAAPGDPWEGLNRRGYAINAFLDKVLIRPVAMIYKALTPGPIGRGLHNIIVNLGEPLVFINDVLQARPRRAAEATVRFAFNSTVGLAGLIDVVAHDGIAHHDSTFGDTLGRYGAGPGPYLFIPVLGPSTVRDFVGAGVDGAVDPVHWISYPARTEISTGATVVGGLDTRVGADEDLKAILADAADPYATLRSVYLQYRQGEIDEIRGGARLPALPEIDESAPSTPSLPPLGEVPAKPGMGAAPSTPSGSPRSGGGEALPPSALDQAAPLESLPNQQGRQADGQVAGPLDE
jgi:phospholipid-binding lipoprotein MlaA